MAKLFTPTQHSLQQHTFSHCSWLFPSAPVPSWNGTSFSSQTAVIFQNHPSIATYSALLFLTPSSSNPSLSPQFQRPFHLHLDWSSPQNVPLSPPAQSSLKDFGTVPTYLARLSPMISIRLHLSTAVQGVDDILIYSPCCWDCHLDASLLFLFSSVDPTPHLLRHS